MEVQMPVCRSGRPIEVGDRVQLPDGSLLKVAAVAFTADGAFVSGKPPVEGKAWVAVDEGVDEPRDSQGRLEADMALGPAAYCSRRALDAGPSANDKLAAMLADVAARSAALARSTE